jgi:hypothetical protein
VRAAGVTSALPGREAPADLAVGVRQAAGSA